MTKLTRRGYAGRGRGRASYVDVPREFTGTTAQVCGLWPWSVGSTSPTIGVPIGPHLSGETTVNFDCVSWFEEAKLLLNPSVFVLGLPAIGKALDVDTPIPTPGGWATMGALAPGDAVFDERGKPTTVVAVSAVMADRDCYELTFSDGEQIVADAGHLWVTETVTDRIAAAAIRRGDRQPPRRRPLGTPTDLAAVGATQSQAGLVVTSVGDLSRDLGWPIGGAQYNVLWRLAKQAAPVVCRGGSDLYSRDALLAATADHLAAPMHDQRTTRTVTTRDIAASLQVGGKTNHAIPVARPIDLPAVDLPLDPYLLGVWAGDGTSAAATITTPDPEIVEELRRLGYEVTKLASPYRYAVSSPGTARSTSSVLATLRDLGVLGNKHLPTTYSRASIAQRRALLAGLLDTDGTVSPAGQVQYSSTSRRLALDVYDLVASLGFRPTIREHRATLDGRDCGPCWTIGFTTTDPDLFRLPRKQAALAERCRSTGARTRLRYITGCRPVASLPVRCIQVAAASGLFLAGRTYIPTHNSTFIRRQVLGLSGAGVIPLILGDLKPDYVDLIRSIGGQVVSYGRGAASLNILAVGAMDTAARTVEDLARTEPDRRKDLLAEADRLRSEAHSRRLNAVCAQLALIRREQLHDYEEVLLSAALRELVARWRRRKLPPVMADLHALIDDAPEHVKRVTGYRGSEDRYRAAVDKLQQTILAWLDGPLGEVFGRQTSTSIELDNPGGVCIDISGISRGDVTLQAAALLACWSEGFGHVEAANALADVGAGPQRRYFVVLDELWRPLAAAVPGVVDRINELTRLNRGDAVGVAMITHSLADLRAMRDQADQAKAAGFVERAGAVVCGGLPLKELAELTNIVPFTDAERGMIASWATPPGWDPAKSPPGMGKFLVKVGQRPGIPVRVQLTQAEIDADVNNTNRRWIA
jgi:LAGLIDADG-like domain